MYIYGVEKTFTQATFSEFLSYGDVIDLDYKTDGFLSLFLNYKKKIEFNPILKLYSPSRPLARSGKQDIIGSLYDPTKKVTYDIDKEIETLYEGEPPTDLLSARQLEPISYRNYSETYDEPIDALVSSATKDFMQVWLFFFLFLFLFPQILLNKIGSD